MDHELQYETKLKFLKNHERRFLRPRIKQRILTLHTKINNNVLLCSTGKCIQYARINCNGKEYKNECIYVYKSHFAVQQKLIQHCKSTIHQ